MESRMFEIDEAIQKFEQKGKDQKKKLHNEYACENKRLLEKIFGNFLEYVAVYWEDITDLLINDILEEAALDMT